MKLKKSERRQQYQSTSVQYSLILRCWRCQLMMKHSTCEGPALLLPLDVNSHWNTHRQCIIHKLQATKP